MAKERNAVNYDDVTIMYGATIISGVQIMTICPELSLHSDSLTPNCCKVTYNISPQMVIMSLGKQAENFLEHMANILWSPSAHKHYRSHSTALCIPALAEASKERQIQDINYGSFVHTMAEMFKKYAPQLLN